MAGALSPRAQGLVTEWAALRRNELLDAWAKAEEMQPLPWIEALPWDYLCLHALPNVEQSETTNFGCGSRPAKPAKLIFRIWQAGACLLPGFNQVFLNQCASIPFQEQ